MKERGEEEGRRKGAGEWRGCREIGTNGRKGGGEEVRAEGGAKKRGTRGEGARLSWSQRPQRLGFAV